jgi:ribosomal protein L7/L12
MKIQVTLTSSELKSIVARHLNLPNGLNAEDMTVTISDESVDLRWSPLERWNSVAKDYPHRKIEAIKAVRTEYPGTGLAEAKYAVEASWSFVKDYVTRNGSLSGFTGALGY